MSEHRERLIKLGSATAFLALAVVAVLIVVSANKSSGGDSNNIADVKVVKRQLAGIPQQGMTIGDPSAKVTLLEFGDLQCPVCKAFASEAVAQIIHRQVRQGEAKIDFRNYTIIGPQSVPAGAAAIAAGEQGHGWNFIELFYRNQGSEDSGYADDKFLTAIAKGAGVPNIAKWNADRKSSRVLGQVEASTAQAEQLGFSGTPSFAVEGPGTSGLETIDTTVADPTAALESAISAAR